MVLVPVTVVMLSKMVADARRNESDDLVIDGAEVNYVRVCRPSSPPASIRPPSIRPRSRARPRAAE